MNGYDAWRLQTPEEFYGPAEYCDECGEDFNVFRCGDETYGRPQDHDYEYLCTDCADKIREEEAEATYHDNQ